MVCWKKQAFDLVTFWNEKQGLLSSEECNARCLVIRAVREGFLSDWRVKGRLGEHELISHLLYADDTFVFCKLLQISCLWFKACGCLKINIKQLVQLLELHHVAFWPPNFLVG